MDEALRRGTPAFQNTPIQISLNISLDKKSKLADKLKDRIVNTDAG